MLMSKQLFNSLSREGAPPCKQLHMQINFLNSLPGEGCAGLCPMAGRGFAAMHQNKCIVAMRSSLNPSVHLPVGGDRAIRFPQNRSARGGVSPSRKRQKQLYFAKQCYYISKHCQCKPINLKSNGISNHPILYYPACFIS